jgi:hypothetical protein
VYSCFGIFSIFFLQKVTLIVRHPWKTIYRGNLITILVNITDEQVLAAVEKLNHQPRKVLGFRTPYEVFFGVKVRYAKQPSVVELRT